MCLIQCLKVISKSIQPCHCTTQLYESNTRTYTSIVPGGRLNTTLSLQLYFKHKMQILYHFEITLHDFGKGKNMLITSLRFQSCCLGRRNGVSRHTREVSEEKSNRLDYEVDKLIFYVSTIPIFDQHVYW